jgi:hypothetical protein
VVKANVLQETPDQADEPTAEETPDESVAPRPWRRAVLAGLVVWVASKVGLAGATAIAWIGQDNPKLTLMSAANRWGTRWDSVWFLTIAQHGYPEEGMAHAAFFPLYPALIRLFTPIFLGQYWMAALFVANVAMLAALVLLYRLTEHEFGRAPAGRTIFYLVAFPTGFFLTAAYNEGLFIALIVGSVYCMRLGGWWLAGVLGAFAGAARPAGILLTLPFAVEYLRQHGRRIRLDALAIGVIPLGLVAVMITDNAYYGRPLAFFEAQAEHWGRHLNWPWKAIIDATAYVTGRKKYPLFGEVWLHNALELGTVLLLLVLIGLAFAGPWRMRRDQVVFPLFGLVLILFMISFPTIYISDAPYPLQSTSRIGLEVFPAFMILGRLGRSPWIDRSCLVLFLTMQGILAAHFLQEWPNSWVA